MSVDQFVLNVKQVNFLHQLVLQALHRVSTVKQECMQELLAVLHVQFALLDHFPVIFSLPA
jgi:hypothetical protein